jgi:hypothetical protein
MHGGGFALVSPYPLGQNDLRPVTSSPHGG